MQHKNVIFFTIVLFCIGFTGLLAQTVKDIDGNIYKTVNIGTQVWITENLKTTKYNDGTPIQLVSDEKAWAALTSPAYCWYKNDAKTYKYTYGALYNWYTVNANKLCPKGWHIPTDAEWTTLTIYLGGESVAGGKLKEKGTSHWESPNTGATNESGFTALSSGYRKYSGVFEYAESNVDYHCSNGWWWSSTDLYTFNAYYRRMYHSLISIYRGFSAMQFGYSVRCLKN